MIALRNTQDTYGAVAKTLHWLIALAVLGMMLMGLFLDEIPRGALKFQVMNLHKAMGVTILALMVLRLGWKAVNWGTPAPNAGHQKWEQMLAGAVHWAFYGLLIVMPLSGWLMSNAANYPFQWFGLFNVPVIVGPDKELAGLFKEVHEITASLIWVALAAHIGGALKHMIIDKDGTIRRMLPVLFLALLPVTALAQEGPQWTIDRDHSTISVEALQDNAKFTAQFAVFDGSISFDPEKPEQGHASITIDLASFDSQNTQRDEMVEERDWFDIATTPTAIYKIKSFQKKSGAENTYIADGALLLRGIERALPLEFTIDITEKDHMRTAHVVGATDLKRLDYLVGQGEWADESVVADGVHIAIDVTATAKMK